MTDGDTDGWRWEDRRWRERVDDQSELALVVEALRRAIDLRDALAVEGSRGTARALMLLDVLNQLFGVAVARRAGGSCEPPHGTGAEIVRQLYEQGFLTSREYRPRI